MRRLLIAGVGWTLGWAALAHADDGPWRSAGPAVTLGKPRAAERGRVRPLRPADPAVTPAAFATDRPYVARGQQPELQALPVGPPLVSAQPGGSDTPATGPQPRPLESSPAAGPAISSAP